MVKYFYVKNFCSIKNRIDISFETTKTSDETFYENYFKYKELDILKVVSFYGMNASGKSSIIKALAALRELVVATPTLPYHPFEFDEISKISPIELGIEFSYGNNENSSLYRYFVSYNKDFVLKEKFEKMTSQKPSLLFERSFSEGKSIIKLGTSIQNNVLLSAIKESVISSKTFLSMFNQFKVDDFYEAYNFFATKLINISPEVTRFDDVIPSNQIINEGFKKFAVNLLKAADFNITDIYIDKSQTKYPLPPIPGVNPEKNALYFVHQGKNNNGGSIEFLNESLGTKKIVVLAERLYPVLSSPSVLIVDELESSLHPELTKLIIKCFLDETINPHNSQLIFTSHETSLLNLNLLRRDEINFVYKDEHTCSTYVRSLKDFHVRKTENVEKSYLAGRYLTSPEVKEQLLEGTINA